MQAPETAPECPSALVYNILIAVELLFLLRDSHFQEYWDQ